MRPERRLLVLYVATVAALAAVWLRVGWIQLFGHDQAVADAREQRERLADVAAGRGRIVDAAGETLAVDRAAVRLVFVPGEWASRHRYRCGACGTVVPRRDPRWAGRPEKALTPPTRCTCGAKGQPFEPLPLEDLAPLEDAIGLPAGTLAGAADDRMRDVLDQIEVEVAEGVAGRPPGTLRALQRLRRAERGAPVPVADVIAELGPELEGRDFYAEDLRIQKRADHFGRATAMMSFHTPAGARLEVRALSPEAERILELDRDQRYRGFRTETFTERWYPRHGLLAQCIGVVSPFRSYEERIAYFKRFGREMHLPDVRIGRLGLEAAYESVLRGTPGRARLARDDDGLFSVRTVVEAPRRGGDVTLHLRTDLCEVLHHALRVAATQEGFAGEGDASAGGILMDAETGAVLAVGEAPSFDPNGRLDEVTSRIDDDEAVAAEAVARREARGEGEPPEPPKPAVTLSRVTRLDVEPGSAMKPFSALAILGAGHVIPTHYACAGRDARVEPKFPRCHPHGPVDCVSGLAHSCNRLFADTASDRAYRAVHTVAFPATAAAFGFGARTGADVFGEGRGAYPAAPGAPLLRQIAIGQAVLVTPLQMARACAALANGGRLPVPRFAAIVDGEPVPFEAVPVELGAGALEQVRAGMRGCVTYGTAKGVFDRPDLAGVTVFGKSGTATVGATDWMDGDSDWVDPDGADGSRAKGPWHLWFVGWATKPGARTVAFAVVLHSRRSGVGGEHAAPVVADLLAAWFGR